MENLKIRRFEEKDRDDMFNNWTSDEEVARYMLYPLHKTIEDAEKAISFFVSNENAFVIDYNNMAVGSFTYTVNKKHDFNVDYDTLVRDIKNILKNLNFISKDIYIKVLEDIDEI